MSPCVINTECFFLLFRFLFSFHVFFFFTTNAGLLNVMFNMPSRLPSSDTLCPLLISFFRRAEVFRHHIAHY